MASRTSILGTSSRLPCASSLLPRHRHGAGDGPSRGHVRPGHVVDAQGDVAADDHADGRRQCPGWLPCAGERASLAGGARRGAEPRPAAGEKNVPGTVAISPFGPNMRSIVIRIDPHKLRDYNLTPQRVVDALAKGNTIIAAVYCVRMVERDRSRNGSASISCAGMLREARGGAVSTSLSARRLALQNLDQPSMSALPRRLAVGHRVVD